MKELYYYNCTDLHTRKVLGPYENLFNAENIWGNCTDLHGNAQHITGDVTGITGDVSCLTGDTSNVSFYPHTSELYIGDISSLYETVSAYSIIPTVEVNK
jgi:hypothetical protein